MHLVEVRRRYSKRARRRRRIRLMFLVFMIFGILAVLSGLLIVSENILNQMTAKNSKNRNNISNQMSAITPDSKNIPQSLTELLERNPETLDFVLGYPSRDTNNTEIDISGDVTKGEIPLFLQWDERWGYEIYGDDFMAITGCGPTCLAMVRCGLGGDTKWNPYAVACMAQECGYYVDGTGSSWELMSDGAGKIGLISETVTFDETHILESLNAGQPIICSVGAGDFTSSGHFIVLCGVDSYGKIIIRDPNSKINSEKTWDLERVMKQIKNLWAYRLE